MTLPHHPPPPSTHRFRRPFLSPTLGTLGTTAALSDDDDSALLLALVSVAMASVLALVPDELTSPVPAILSMLHLVNYVYILLSPNVHESEISNSATAPLS